MLCSVTSVDEWTSCAGRCDPCSMSVDGDIDISGASKIKSKSKFKKIKIIHKNQNENKQNGKVLGDWSQSGWPNSKLGPNSNSKINLNSTDLNLKSNCFVPTKFLQRRCNSCGSSFSCGCYYCCSFSFGPKSVDGQINSVDSLSNIQQGKSERASTSILTTSVDFTKGPAPGSFMWRSGRGGTGSGPVGEIGAGIVVGVKGQSLRPESVGSGGGGNVNNTVSSANVTSSQWHHQQSISHSHQQQRAHQQAPRRCDSSELADSPIRAEAIKLVRDLNRAVATHVALAALLGGSGDGPHLRDELRRARRTAQEAAAAAKATILPALLDPRWAEKERAELERLWHLLLCCLDSLETSMQRSLILLREFSIADGSNILIHTGLDGPNATNHHAIRSYTTHSAETDVPLLDKLALEGVEASQLCKELFELRAQLLELKSAVEIRSLLSPPDCFVLNEIVPLSHKKPRRNDTLLSINGTDQNLTNAAPSSISCSIASDDKESLDSDLESTSNGITGAQRKCVCLILACMVTVFVLAMFAGVVFALVS